MCNENRDTYKGGPKDTPMFNTIGGKVEGDEDILATAVREFSEEALLDVEDQEVLNELVKTNIFYYDFCCSTQKQLYHRFYVVDLKTEYRFDQVDGMVEAFSKRKTEDSGVNQLVWLNRAESIDGVKHTNLITEFFKFVEEDRTSFTTEMYKLLEKYGDRFNHLIDCYVSSDIVMDLSNVKIEG